MVDNAETDGYYIVYGHGGTQMINAASYALALVNGKKLPVFAQIPYYNQYPAWAQFNALNNYWNSSLYQNNYQNDIIEFVTYPNNPDGSLRVPYYSSSSNLIYDMVYYWPTWTNVSTTANHDIMIFSLSKLTGHAGSRFGWALVKDANVAKEMRSMINLLNIHTSLDAVHRAIQILNTMVDQDGEFFTAIASVMEERYNELIPLFNSQSRFTLESVTSPPTWFYLWIKCEQDANCYQVFEDANIIGEAGSVFGASDQYLRIQLTVRTSDYNLFLNNLKNLISSSS